MFEIKNNVQGISQLKYQKNMFIIKRARHGVFCCHTFKV